MKRAEEVTFGGSGLDRAGEMRGDPDAVARAVASPEARAIALWRGRPLLCGADQTHLARLPMDHPALGAARAAPILLGREGGAPRFAVDLSAWEPQIRPDPPEDAFVDVAGQGHPLLPADHVFCELRARMAQLGARDAELAATAKAILQWHRTHGFCSRCGARSRIIMAGWQTICDACGGHHFPRTDPVVIMLITYGNSVLMGRSPGWPEGMYSLLAGFVEPGETIEAAVRREVYEETAVHVGEVGYLGSQPWAFPASLMIGCEGRATSAAIRVDPTEIEAARWVSREEMMAVFSGDHPEIRPARRGAIAHFLLHNWLADRLD